MRGPATKEAVRGLRGGAENSRLKILRSQINCNETLPPIREHGGCVNRVLAVRADSKYDNNNADNPKWDVVNTVYYNAHKDDFEGWIELEDSLPPG